MAEQDPVVVVGAGPVGQIAALALARRGMPVVVVEADSQDRPRPGSRAIGLYRPTLQRLDSVLPGLGREIAERGVSIGGADVDYAGRRVCHLPSNPVTAAAGRSLPQRVTEELVHEACVEHGVRFLWETPVDDVITDERGATIVLASGDKISTPYVIAADGARSVVRKAIGVSMEGHTDPTPFIIADVDEHPDGSTRGMPAYFHYRCPELGGRNVMHMPFAGGMRVDLQCLPDDDPEYLTTPDGIREWMPKVLDPWYAEHVQWVSSYRFHQVIADSYTDQHQRVLLAGEAAHLFAPWGGRGLNSGVMDATDAADAVATALATGDRKPIERCARDRRTWGLRNRRVSDYGLRMLRGEDRFMRVAQPLAARVAPWFWPAGWWLADAPIQLRPPQLRPYGWY